VAERSGDPRWPIAPPGAGGLCLNAGAWFEGSSMCKVALEKAGVDVLTLDRAGEGEMMLACVEDGRALNFESIVLSFGL